jgi:hypothetical protein
MQTMKGTILLVTIMILISAAPITVLQQQHYQTAHAFPCIGGSIKKIDYCTGYHAGAIEAHRDFNSGYDLAIDQHPCTPSSTDYCNGYDRGYSDEADFLG